MFDSLYKSLIKHCLVGGVSSKLGWGNEVKRNVLPLLDHPKLRHHRNIISEGLERSREPISVFVVGEGKFGKSTLINALVGEYVAAVHFIPKTWHITRYTPVGRKPRYEIHYDLSQKSATRFERDCRSLSKSIRFTTGVVLCDSDESLDRIIQNEDSHHDRSSESPIWQVVKPLPATETTRLPLEIVDTPGIRQHRSTKVKEESLDDFYHRADVVLWIVIADKINSGESRKSMQAMSRYGKPIILVVNHADKIPPNRRRAVRADAQRAYGNWIADIALVSARDAYEGRKKGDRSLFRSSGLGQLEDRMEDLVGLKGAETKALSLLATSRQAARECGEILTQEAATLQRNIDTFSRNLSTAREFNSPANRLSEQGLSGLSDVVGRTAAMAMRKYSRTSASDTGKPFDEKRVKSDVAEVVEEYAYRIAQQLHRHLSTIQDQIVARPYFDQTYGADAKVRSQETRISFEVEMQDIASSIDISSIRIEYDFMDKFEDFAGEVYDFVAGIFGAARSAAQKTRAKRERDLEKYIQASDKLGPRCRSSLKWSIEAGIVKTQEALEGEVVRCFERSFESLDALKRTRADLLDRARKAAIPPPILFTATRMLRAALR